MSDAATNPIFTIGHSNMDAAAFVQLLQQHKIQTVADVRSSPYSQYTPQFNREVLQTTLKQNGISYVFLGDELGARRSEREVYENGQAVYERIATTPLFKSGLERVLSGAKKFRIAFARKKTPSPVIAQFWFAGISNVRLSCTRQVREKELKSNTFSPTATLKATPKRKSVCSRR